MKRHEIEFLWAWFDAVRCGDTETMAAALDPGIVWQGIREDLVCTGPGEVAAMFVEGYDALQEIDSLELLGGEGRIVVGVRAAAVKAINDVEIGGAIYNVFTIENERIIRIEDYLRREDALAAAGVSGAA